MRQRGGDTEQKPYTQPSVAAAAAARKASKHSSARQSRRHGFWVGTGCFFLFLLVYINVRNSPATSSTPLPNSTRKTSTGLRVAERDIVALGLITQQVEDLATLPRFQELSKSAAQVGVVYLPLLEQVAAADALDDGGHALRQLDVSQHYLTNVSGALRRAADVSYTKLKRMLLHESDAELAEAPTSLVRTMYGWMLSDLFLYSAVLPEYYLLKDDTAAHAVVLLRSVNLLFWSASVHTVAATEAADAQLVGSAALPSYDIFNWSGGAACRRGPLGALSKHWMQFCETSFSSTSSVARRVAATYEELIALFPGYAPLRLHYAIAFAFLGPNLASGAGGSRDASVSLTEHSMKALQVIRNDREKLGTKYKQVDSVHIPVLMLLEAYLTPVSLWTSEQETQLVHALSELKDCEHVKRSLLTAPQWSISAFQKEYRVPLLNAEQLSVLLAKAQVLLGAVHASVVPFRDCM